MLGTPSVANATGSEFIYDDSRYFGILELLKWLLGLFWLLGSFLDVENGCVTEY